MTRYRFSAVGSSKFTAVSGLFFVHRPDAAAGFGSAYQHTPLTAAHGNRTCAD
ncbi:hypothetical protein L810_2986 [Burkholderia sp. AU4i]|nr:hypothetical protein L810_2986 [Burkholderia sp. AU4i]MDW9249321.1 hypothetical protein [Burkholderia cepacia]